MPRLCIAFPIAVYNKILKYARTVSAQFRIIASHFIIFVICINLQFIQIIIHYRIRMCVCSVCGVFNATLSYIHYFIIIIMLNQCTCVNNIN